MFTALELYIIIMAHQIVTGQPGEPEDGTALQTKGEGLLAMGVGLVEEEVQVVEKASFKISLRTSKRVWKRIKRFKRV